jgi:type IV pilus assembly protein PilN
MIRINLLPAPTRKAISLLPAGVPWFGIAFGVIAVALVGGIGSYWYLLNQEGNRLRSDIAQAQKDLDSLKSIIAEGNKFKQEKEDLERRLALIELLARNQARPVYLLDTIADMIPRELWLTGVEEKQNQLRLAGSAYSENAVADLMSNLIASKKFKDVDLSISKKDLAKPPNLVTFEVICSFEI